MTFSPMYKAKRIFITGWSIFIVMMMSLSLVSIGVQAQDTYTTIKKPKSVAAFLDSVGINTHLEYPESNYNLQYDDVVYPRLEELGITHLRQPLWSELIADTQHEVELQKRLLKLRKEGYSFVAPVSNYRWLSEDGNVQSYMPADILIDKAKEIDPDLNSIEAWEGINKYDERYPWYVNKWEIEDIMLESTKDARRVVDADAIARTKPILAPSFSVKQYVADEALVDEVDLNNANPYYDLKPPEWTGWLNTYLTEHSRVAPGKPFWVTEFGWNTGELDFSVTPEIQSMYTMRHLFYAFDRGIERSYVYELMDFCDDPLDASCNVGLIDYQGYPKPAFYTLKNTLQILGNGHEIIDPVELDYRISSIKKDSPYVTVLPLQKSLDTYSFVVWLPGENYYSQETGAIEYDYEFTIPDALEATIYKPSDSNEGEPLRVQDGGTFEAQISDDPHIIEVRVDPSLAAVNKQVAGVRDVAGQVYDSSYIGGSQGRQQFQQGILANSTVQTSIMAASLILLFVGLYYWSRRPAHITHTLQSKHVWRDHMFGRLIPRDSKIHQFFDRVKEVSDAGKNNTTWYHK